MRHQLWLSLPLAAALIVPAVAQQDNPDSAGPNPPAATQSAPEQSRPPLEAERHEGFWGHLNPFARKKYVQRQMQPIRDRVNELDDLTAANAKAIRDVDARATEGIRMASAKADAADQHAIDAGNRAQQANLTATQANTRLNTVEDVVGNLDQYQPVTQADIHFRPGQIVLSKKAKDVLDQIAESVKDQKGYIVQVQGFAPGRGNAAIENSQRMAQSVERYLVLAHDIPVYRIYLVGMGNVRVASSSQGTAARRTTSGGRVEVSLLKNGVDQLGAANHMASGSEQPSGAQGEMGGTTAQQR